MIGHRQESRRLDLDETPRIDDQPLLMEKQAKLRDLEQQERARVEQDGKLRSAIARSDVAAIGELLQTINNTPDIPELLKQMRVLSDEITELRGTLSYEIFSKFAAANAANHRRLLEAMTAFDDAMRTALELPTRLANLGYTHTGWAMPLGIQWSLWQALHEARYPDGAVARLRKFIEEKL